MVSNLEYESSLGNIYKHVFGKTLICRNIEVATSFSRAQNLDCVTLEGEPFFICNEDFFFFASTKKNLVAHFKFMYTGTRQK